MNENNDDALIGTPLPALTLGSTAGKSLTLPEGLGGSWSILYFYPKDDTPGCTKQACAYRDNLPSFEEVGARVYGISLDDLDSHAAFRQKFGLNFPLLTDTDKALSTALGVYRAQEWQGKTFHGLSRDTFLIDPKGIIRKVWRSVDPTTTMGETFEAMMALRGDAP